MRAMNTEVYDLGKELCQEERSQIATSSAPQKPGRSLLRLPQPMFFVSLLRLTVIHKEIAWETRCAL
jgi:hypothetical protein